MITMARVVDLYIDDDAPGGSACLLDGSGARRSAGPHATNDTIEAHGRNASFAIINWTFTRCTN